MLALRVNATENTCLRHGELRKDILEPDEFGFRNCAD